MTKKKFYQQPQAKFIEVKQADIIATSPGGYNEGNILFNGGNDYTFGEEDF